MSANDSRTRVLVFIKGLGLGGAEKLIIDGAAYWNRERFDYHVAYVLPWKDHLTDPLRRLGVPVTCLGGNTGMDLLTPLRLRRLLRRRDIQLVHAHSPSVGVMARLATRRPIIYTEHNLAGSYRQPTRYLNRVTYGLNRSTTAVSPAVAESVRSFRGASPLVIENGVAMAIEPKEVSEARRELGLTERQPLVVHVGNIRPHKGHQTLIRAVQLLSQRRPDVLTVSIGAEKHAGDLAAVRAKALEYGIGDRLLFLGRREDARSFIAAADVYVNPADIEGLPVSVLEAQALARPVVATRVGGVPSVVVDGVTGRLVDPGDDTALADAIIDVLEHPSRAVEMGMEARRLVTENHGLKEMVGKYEHLYDRVLRARP